jgi:hypothetical protein
LVIAYGLDEAYKRYAQPAPGIERSRRPSAKEALAMDDTSNPLPNVSPILPNVIPFPDLPDQHKRALMAIDRFIANPPDNSRVFWITPEMATYLLEKYNIANRPHKPTKIGLYAAAMQAGEWRLTGDTLKFSDRGICRDGQNRLLASAASGSPFQTHVVFGVPDEFFSAMDQGKNRDGSDLLAIAGVANSTIVSAGIRWAHLYDTGTVKLRTTLQAPETLRLYEERYHNITRFVPIARSIYSTHKWPAGFIVGTLNYLAGVDAKAADEFAQAMANSQFSGKYLPLNKMNGALIGVATVSSGRINDVYRAAVMVIAWNLIRTGKKGKQSDFGWDSTREPFPVAI